MKGRKPTPTPLRLANGNPGRRPVPKDEPKPDVEVPTCPDHLSDTAKTEWERLTKELARLGMVSRIDRAALAVLCQAWGRWLEAEEKIKEHGAVIKSPSGFPQPNPYLTVANKAADQLGRLLPEFGLTPSSRTRIKVSPSAKLQEFRDQTPRPRTSRKQG